MDPETHPVGGEPKGPPEPLIVGVGASAGGLEAVSELLRNLPSDTGVAIVLVQHLDPRHQSILAEILGKHTTMPVVQVQDDVRAEPNHVYVIPPNATMLIADGTLRLSKPVEELSYQRRPIDAFFKSLAENMKERAIGVVLSGAASDGTLGLKAIKAAGGITFAQDATAKFDSMPQSAIMAGFVDFVLPPSRIAQELATIARHPLTGQVPEQLFGDLPTIDRILWILRKNTGVDFSQYKQPTIHRRLARRMVLQKIENLEAYLELLRREPREVEALFDDLLIKVTEFFRDPAVFGALQQIAFPQITKDHSKGDAVRVWVPGCSTGEEVYSIAISLIEYLDAKDLPIAIQVFGTDASETVIEKARSGIYDQSISSSVSPERLKRFFSAVDGKYQISRGVRDVCIFSRHNLGVDPPLSRMQLISCRNLLIYFAPVLQQKAVDVIAYALSPAGCLLVGTSENTSRLSELFTPLDEEHRIYCRKSRIDVPPLQLISNIAGQRDSERLSRAPSSPAQRGGVHAFVDRMLLSRYGPSGLVLDKDLKIIEFRGEVISFLERPDVVPGTDFMEVIREDLAGQIRAAIVDAHRRSSTVRVDEIRMRGDSAPHFARITVIPVTLQAGEEFSVILFENLGIPDDSGAKQARPAESERLQFQDPAEYIEHLERQVASNREYLQSIIEELRSTNEEAQSANEELQSSNEELQTTKEELQASNEELSTINDEMRTRNAQLGLLNDDLLNLFGSINSPVVMVGNDLRIRRFTPAAEKVLRLIPSDVGRPISDLQPRINVPSLDAALRDVLDTLKPREQEVEDREGRGYLMNIRPYRTTDNRIEGAVLVLTDITELKRGIEEIRRARDYASAIVDTVREPLLVLDEKLTVRSANHSFYKFFQVDARDVEGRGVLEIARRQLDLAPVRQLLERLMQGEISLEDVEIERDFQPMGLRILLLNARRIPGSGSVLLAFDDITERKQAAEARYRRLFESARDGIIIIDEASGKILDLNPYAEQLFGYTLQELAGQPIWDSEPARGTPELRAAIEQIRDQRAARFPDMSFKTKEGRTVETESIGNVYSEGDRRAIQLNIRDLSERRKFERELQHSQKLESLGLLAGGIAHDFNNLLTGIMGNASLVYADTPAGNPSRVQLRSIISASERAAHLTRQLLAYAGKGKFVNERVNLSDLIREILVLIQSSIPQTVEVKLDLNPKLPPIEGDPGQIQQLAMNLVINAAEAVGQGNAGSVEVRTSTRDLTAQDIRETFMSEGLTPGAYVLLEVRDTGVGMDEATKARIFDPFFTTKFTGRGLGLAAVSGIVGTLRGAIRVYSTPGQGSTFHILLPAADPALRTGRTKRVRATLNGSGTILLVDDEEIVRQTAYGILSRAGFEVLQAERGPEAVEIFRKNSQRISLVILDLNMPGMGGEQVFDELRAIRPDVPCLLASGYGESEAAERTGGRDFAGFLQKPFSLTRLMEVVGTVLNLGPRRPVAPD